MKSYPWIYKPGFDDRLTPVVLFGSPIALDARVRLAPEHTPIGCKGGPFRAIQDKHGNVQNVWKRALVRPSKAG